MTYYQSCAYCDAPRNQKTGRPSQWCSPPCKAAGEAEIRRLGRLLGRMEEGRAVDALNGATDTTRRDGVIDGLRDRLDQLYGVRRFEAAQ